jgi:hypothetical protein
MGPAERRGCLVAIKIVTEMAGSGTAGDPAARNNVKAYFTPAGVAERWEWHEESIRRALRQRRMASVIIGGRRLIPAAEVERVESEGFIPRAA